MQESYEWCTQFALGHLFSFCQHIRRNHSVGVVEHMDEQDNAKRFDIVGVEDADKIRKDLWNTVNSREKVNINLLYDDDIQTIDIDGKKIIAINVPRADYTVRPVYINNNLSRGTFKRNHEGDYHCTEQELKMMLRDANLGKQPVQLYPHGHSETDT